MGHEAPSITYTETSSSNISYTRPTKTPKLVHTTFTTANTEKQEIDTTSRSGVSDFNLKASISISTNGTTGTSGTSHPANSEQLLARGGRNNLDDSDTIFHSQYPYRIINTHTLQFEMDYKLFRNNYATFSHTWVQEGTEVDFGKAIELLARARWAMVKRRKEQLRVVGVGETKIDEKCVLDTVGNAGNSSEGIVGTSEDRYQEPLHMTQAEAKLLRVIKAAKDLGYTYVWIDNCCINQADNIELTEALSSMGEWYANASICLVYLEDYTRSAQEFQAHIEAAAGSEDLGARHQLLALEEPTASCRWATRGWTLQEIVMSRRATFYNSNWEKILDTADDDRLLQQPGFQNKVKTPRSTQSLLSCKLSRLCRVPRELICYGQKPNIPAAVLMNMAAQRTTRRIEDGVYSLLGMLGVRMKADYGEGLSRAIERLLEELIRSGIADASIFNWVGQSRGNPLPGRSMYPLDLEGYDVLGDISNLREEFKVPGGMELSLDPPGIWSCFDVYPVQSGGIKFLEIPQLLAESDPNLDASSLANPGPDRRNIDTTCTLMQPIKCTISLHEDLVLEVSMSCPLALLPEHLDSLGFTPDLQWAFVRFSQVKGANWFLCAIPASSSKCEIKRMGTSNTSLGSSLDKRPVLERETSKKRKIGLTNGGSGGNDCRKHPTKVSMDTAPVAYRMATGEFSRVRVEGAKAEALSATALNEILTNRLSATGGEGLKTQTHMVIG